MSCLASFSPRGFVTAEAVLARTPTISLSARWGRPACCSSFEFCHVKARDLPVKGIHTTQIWVFVELPAGRWFSQICRYPLFPIRSSMEVLACMPMFVISPVRCDGKRWSGFGFSSSPMEVSDF
jgi:hypothetical protein